MRRRLAVIGVLATLSVAAACTPEEVGMWQAWHAQDPQAANAFAANLGAKQPNEPPQGVWDQIAQCESGGNWSINTGNGYSGGLQFLHSTWRAYGGTQYAPLAYQATRAQQIDIAERVLADAGWGAWPTCSRRLGLR